MKTSSTGEENHNLVMFPSSKNFKIDLTGIELGHDPLQDLLNEYSHLKDEDLPEYLDDRFEIALEENFTSQFEDELDGDAFHSLEAFMNRSQLSETQSPDDKLIKMINERIEAIKEAKERIKYYLDELDMFLPSRRK